MGELNPDFSFDFGGGDDSQAPWEFAGALAQAQADTRGDSALTSIDQKIAAQLTRRTAANGWKLPTDLPAAAAGRKPGVAAKGGRVRGPAAAAAAADSSGDEDDSEEEAGLSGSEDDDSDAPLPGEVDADSDEDEEQQAASSEEEEEEEEEGEEDDIARAGMELDSDELQTSDEEADEEEPAPQPGKRQRGAAAELQQQQQRGKQQQKEQQQQQQQEAQPRRGAAAGAADGRERQAGEEGGAGKHQKGGKAGFFDAAPKDTKFSAQSFADLHLSRPLLKACQSLGYSHPTPIQAACIPLALAGRDICGSAVTGSGKTAAFSLPCLERLLQRNKRMAATYVLVLTPVRELAVQVHSMIQKLAQFTDIQAALVVGGLSLQAQAATLRTSPEIVVATPGRMIDHLRNTQSVGLEDLAVLILDEADRLLEMGFSEEIHEVVRQAPPRRQTMLFSATMTEEVQKLVSLSLKHPVRLAADASGVAPKELTQEIVRLKGGAAAQKEAALLALCSKAFQGGRTIIFSRTKQRAHRLKMLFGLAALPPAGELHGDMTQAARLESLERFRKGEVAFLLATDVAARGLDILGVETVINFDCPTQLSSYLHRVGRTARAGAKGRALTFIEDGDRALLKEVIKRTGVQMQQRQVPQASVDRWQGKVEALEPQVEAIIWEEREERALRKAEMEAQKAVNLIEHEDEIMARPPRTWFQSERQKKETAARARDAAEGGDEGGSGDEGGGEPLSSKQKKAKAKNEKRLEQKQARAKQESDAAKRRGSNKLMEETAGLKRSIKAVKAREQQLRLEGMTGGKAGKVAASLVTGVKRKKKSKKGKASQDKEGGGKGELFDGDGLPSKPSASGSKVYAGGARSGKLKVPAKKGGLSKPELNRVKRGGKGHHGFKSKAKHRRR